MPAWPQSTNLANSMAENSLYVKLKENFLCSAFTSAAPDLQHHQRQLTSDLLPVS